MDVFLTERLGGSRGRVQRQTARGDVVVNGAVVRASHKLKLGDVVEVEVGEVETDAADAPIVPEAIALDVLFEDDDFAVIAKPAGMVVHPAGAITGGTLANALAHRWGAPPGLVHRLDRDTSGVMVIARTVEARARLIAQFAGARRRSSMSRSSTGASRRPVDASTPSSAAIASNDSRW